MLGKTIKNEKVSGKARRNMSAFIMQMIACCGVATTNVNLPFWGLIIIIFYLILLQFDRIFTSRELYMLYSVQSMNMVKAALSGPALMVYTAASNS